MPFPSDKFWQGKLHINSPQSLADDGPSAVVISGLGYRYPGQETSALQEIALAIPAGSCFGLLGPNGAGKTTLISLLTGVLKVQQGEIATPIANTAGTVSVALVPQEYAFYPTLSGRENLEFFAGLYGLQGAECQQQIEQCADICALTDVLDKPARHYSGGIKRRLNIAIGLLCRPSVLYLDEPTVGIDAQSRHFILEGIKQLKASGMTIVYTSHYMEEVEQLCDQVAIIDHGRLVLQRPMAQLLSEGARLQIEPAGEPSPQRVASCVENAAVKWDGRRFQVDTSRLSPAAALALLEAEGIAVGEVHMGRHRLEELYLSVTEPGLRD